MNIGIGLPITDPTALLNWAQRAEACQFSTLALLDRLVYDNPEPSVSLAAIAGVTSRIRVQTEVLLAPLRESALLAKQCATLDRISGGRFTLGLGVGGREDDHIASGTNIRDRGRRLDWQIQRMREIWSSASGSEHIGPIPTNLRGPEVLFGAFAGAAVARVAKWGDGFIGAAPIDYTDKLFRTVEKQWAEAGRCGTPKLIGQVNVAIGPEQVIDEARHNIEDYYEFTGNSGRFAENMCTTASRVRAAVAEFSAIGADEIILYCWSADVRQLDRLHEAVA